EEDARKSDADRDRDRVGEQPASLLCGRLPPLHGLESDQLAVDVRQSDREGCAEQAGDHRPGRRRMRLQRDHQRQADDRAVDDPGDGAGAEAASDHGWWKSISLITLAGTPAAITPAGMSRVTTELAPITARSPISTPPVTTQFTPNQQLEPIRTGPCGSKPCQVTGLVGSS